jgi:hypothetical protein
MDKPLDSLEWNRAYDWKEHTWTIHVEGIKTEFRTLPKPQEIQDWLTNTFGDIDELEEVTENKSYVSLTEEDSKRLKGLCVPVSLNIVKTLLSPQNN